MHTVKIVYTHLKFYNRFPAQFLPTPSKRSLVGQSHLIAALHNQRKK